MELAQSDWNDYFERMSSEPGLLVAIESVGRRSALEERISAMCEGVCTRHPLRSICYERGADVFEVAAGLAAEHGPLLRFFVSEPRSIFVREATPARAIVVTDAGGALTLVCVFPTRPRDGVSSPMAASRTAVTARLRSAPAELHAPLRTPRTTARVAAEDGDVAGHAPNCGRRALASCPSFGALKGR